MVAAQGKQLQQVKGFVQEQFSKANLAVHSLCQALGQAFSEVEGRQAGVQHAQAELGSMVTGLDASLQGMHGAMQSHTAALNWVCSWAKQNQEAMHRIQTAGDGLTGHVATFKGEVEQHLAQEKQATQAAMDKLHARLAALESR